MDNNPKLSFYEAKMMPDFTVDAIVSPTCARPPEPLEGLDPDTRFREPSFVNPYNVLGIPAMSLPCDVTGAGASFPAPLYAKWADAYNKATGARINYQSVGSGAGVRQFLSRTVDFAASDEPIKPEEAARVKRGVVQFPAVGGTIAIAFNKADCKALKLTQKQAVDIFLGKIKTWDQLKCGKGKLTVAHRSDGSGTTFAFTNSLSAFSPEWKSKVGEGKSVKWPVGVGGKGNEGVAGVITNTPGSIGYLSKAFVKGPIKAAALQNKAGTFVMPNLASGTAALNSIASTGSGLDASGPISSFLAVSSIS